MNKEEKNQFIVDTVAKVNKIFSIHEKIKDIDLSLLKLYTVAVVEEGYFFIFDLSEDGKSYEFKGEYKAPMIIPEKVLASFPLDFYDMKPAAVVSKDAFNTLEGYIFMFHEFVHCYQWEQGDNEIRETLEIVKIAKEKNDFMWEINHLFPYEDKVFIDETSKLEFVDRKLQYKEIVDYHKTMKNHLNHIDFEYMIWQEFKEGFARYIENLIRERLQVNLNSNKLEEPFSRVSFYELGNKYINFILRENPELKGHIKEIYNKINVV
ncbi:hypothetical protein [Clostridium sp. UBA1056]|uniref:hypothetical protein n=1 Tax=unclassified Clostridium TaxID=2614128 RepID=UPI00321707D4